MLSQPTILLLLSTYLAAAQACGTDGCALLLDRDSCDGNFGCVYDVSTIRRKS